MDSEQEVIYRTNEDSHMVMSEKVQSLAGSVYQEFEKMIAKYDQDVVKDLMPLVVNVLECLDSSYAENQEHEVELELLREDNEQLVTQYEREKQLRKSAEQKLLEVEDLAEDERKDQGSKLESLESIVRMLELKAKNSSDHVFRLEEKESEMKKEYQKLHERYTELFKTHVDYMERTKMMMSTSERLETGVSNRQSRMPTMGMTSFNRSSGPISFGFQSLEEVRPDEPSLNSEEFGGSPNESTASNASLKNEINDLQEGDDNSGEKSHSFKNLSPVGDEDAHLIGGKTTTKKEQRSGNTLYQELSFQDPETLQDADDSGDVTGSWVHPGEYASSGWKSLRVGTIKPIQLRPANDNFFGMGKEVENLILENNELLATKNALNIVKDDLIVKVDELTSELEVLREEMSSLRASKERLTQKITDLEEELKRVKEEATKVAKGGKSDDEDDEVPLACRKRFTRVEMARVLMERNQYKERFMELQEAVRYSGAIRASRNDVSPDKTKNPTFWKLFSNLFKSEKVVSPTMYDRPYHVMPVMPARQSQLGERKRPIDYLDRGPLCSDRMAARRAQYRQVCAHVRKEDGRLQAYGWSLPARVPAVVHNTGRSHVPVPVPVYCQPLATALPSAKCGPLQVWCAAGVNLAGGKTRDGGSIVGASVFYPAPAETSSAPKSDPEPHITSLEDELKEGNKIREEGETLEQRLSSQVWVCSSTHNESRVTVIDATDPANVIESFTVCQSYLLCVSSVPGATESDYRDPESNNNPFINETTAYTGDENKNLGRVTYVKVEKEENAEEPTTGITEAGVLPTMWLGAQSGFLYVHSAISARNTCIASLHLPDSVLCVTYCARRVFVALANGSVAVFQRNRDAQWDFSQYYKVDLGEEPAAVRCMALVHSSVWCGYKNKIHVLDPVTLSVKMSLEAHPRKEGQVRQLAWLGDGVWVSIRQDSTLRLYHAHTYQHLQDVDIEPYVSKMLGTGKLGFSLVRITALMVSTGRLWIGTVNGVVISVPLSEGDVRSADSTAVVRVYKDADSEKITPGSFIPYCSMSEAQLSFHGHRDSVKFFIAVPGSKSGVENPHMLVMSGGEGYIDFRTGDCQEDESGTIPEENECDTEADGGSALGRHLDLSHLVIWQVAIPPS